MGGGGTNGNGNDDPIGRALRLEQRHRDPLYLSDDDGDLGLGRSAAAGALNAPGAPNDGAAGARTEAEVEAARLRPLQRGLIEDTRLVVAASVDPRVQRIREALNAAKEAAATAPEGGLGGGTSRSLARNQINNNNISNRPTRAAAAAGLGATGENEVEEGGGSTAPMPVRGAAGAGAGGVLDAAAVASRAAALEAEQQRLRREQRQGGRPPSATAGAAAAPADAAAANSDKVSIRMRLQGRNRELSVSLPRSAKLKRAFDAFVKAAVERG